MFYHFRLSLFKTFTMANQLPAAESKRIFENYRIQLRDSLVANDIVFVEVTDATEASFMISCERVRGFEVRCIDGINFDAVRIFLRHADYLNFRGLRIHGELFCKGRLCANSHFELWTSASVIRKINELRNAPLASSCGIL